MEKIKKDIDFEKTALLLKIGIAGAFIILAGDILMGWGIRSTDIEGIEGQLSQYLTLSDKRMFLASLCGFLGVPLAVTGHTGIYKLIRPYSKKYSLMYAVGNLGFLAFGGAGVHVSSVEAAFFYKYMTAEGQNAALAPTIKFALYFLLPLYIVLMSCWFIMVYAHLRAVLGGMTPFSRRCWIFSMPAGSLLACTVCVFGNHEIVNALMVGAFSIGNIWTLSGHLIMLRKLQKKSSTEA